MKYFLLFISFSSFSLEIGDVILQPLHCRICSVIENETQSIYSHIGVVIKKNPILVAEAFQEVRVVSLQEFLSKTQRNQDVKVIRNPEFQYIDKDQFLNDFYHHFFGLPYDSKFLWSNNKLYCSELIYKLFKFYNISQPEPKIMSFSREKEFWEQYFEGNIPSRQLGISPASYDLSPYFKEVLR